jgi:cytochrome c553
MQRKTLRVLLLSISFCFSIPASGQDASSDAESFFESKVRPVLATNCVECHGPTKATAPQTSEVSRFLSA